MIGMSWHFYCDSLHISSLFFSAPPDKLFKNKHVEFVLVCIGTINEVDQVFVCGEDQAFFESDCDLVKALVDLISAYYVFDVKYPQCISGVLHFLQEIVLLQSDSEFNWRNQVCHLYGRV